MSQPFPSTSCRLSATQLPGHTLYDGDDDGDGDGDDDDDDDDDDAGDGDDDDDDDDDADDDDDDDGGCTYTHTHTHMHTYIYIYMHETYKHQLFQRIYIHTVYIHIMYRYAMIFTINTKHVLFCWIGYTCSFFHTDSNPALLILRSPTIHRMSRRNPWNFNFPSCEHSPL